MTVEARRVRAVRGPGGLRPRPGQVALYGGIVAAGILAPIVFPAYTSQFAVLWMMVLFALTWDTMGGQMGYNSLGNIFFFGIGMYACALFQVGLYYDIGSYTAAYGAIKVDITEAQYYTGLITGLVAAALVPPVLALLLGLSFFGLRGPYFAIGTLGIAFAGAEMISGWDWVGGGGGIALPVYPGGPGERNTFFYVLMFALAVSAFVFFKWLYGTRFGICINAIRDNEEKAEAMGLHTFRYKAVAWSVAAFFLGITGALFGNMIGFIEPREVAFPTVTFGLFMVAMVLLGGKGTLWGPVVGATLFHVVKEVTWTYFLGWQWVALGLVLIVNIVYFQQGIMGWVQEKWPEKFGIVVDETPGAYERPERPREAAQ